jgi:hypothetical protein
MPEFTERAVVVEGLQVTDEQMLGLKLDEARDALLRDLKAMRQRRPSDPSELDLDHAGLQFAESVFQRVWGIHALGVVARDKPHEFRVQLYEKLIETRKLFGLLVDEHARLPVA